MPDEELEVKYGNTANDKLYGLANHGNYKEWAAFDKFPKRIRQLLTEAPLEYSPKDLRRVLLDICSQDPSYMFTRVVPDWAWRDLEMAMLEQFEADRQKYREHIRSISVIIGKSPRQIAEQYTVRSVGS